MNYTFIDLFCGAGGFSQGFVDAGFKSLLATDIWKSALDTFKHNHEKTIVIEGDLSSNDVKNQIYDTLKNKKVNVIIGGCPCQAYSIAGERNPNDKRGQLYLDFIDIINHFKPDFFVMENVKGLLSMKHVKDDLNEKENKEFEEKCNILNGKIKKEKSMRQLKNNDKKSINLMRKDIKKIKNDLQSYMIPLINKMIHTFNKIGYNVKYEVMNAVDHGVPQKRQRVIFIGTKHGNINIEHPKPSFFNILKTDNNNSFIDNVKNVKKWKTVQEVLKKYEKMKENVDINHVFTKHSPKFIKKIKNTKIGENIYKNYSDAWWRLIPNKPSRTVKENHGGVFIHYDQDRTLTPRELAELQSFDINYIFKGSKSNILKQIGNSVPVLLSKAIALKIKEKIDEISK